SEFGPLKVTSKESIDALGGVRPIKGDRVGNWRNHLPRVAGQLLLHGSISRELIVFGYEKDHDWLGTLEGIEPDFSPSHGEDRPVHFLDRVTKSMRAQMCAAEAILSNVLRLPWG
ncbi:MAG TPA: hypothetical protein VK877_10615, partial [Pseudolabrys sp.]|nr:hypothetical protein [Pseudolabrys sp.]